MKKIGAYHYNFPGMVIILFTMLHFVMPLYAQKIPKDSIVYNVEAVPTFSTGENTPFWLVSNIHGLGSPELNNGFVKGEVFKHMNPSKRFDWGAGADLSAGWHIPAPFAIRQLYGELHYRAIWVSIGSKNFNNGYNDRKLSSGDLLFSENAMAIPQLRVGTNGFASVWGTKGWFSVKAYLGYGMFTDSKWQKHWVEPGGDRASNVLFCSRGLWLRGGNFDKFPLTFDVGIEMGTQFGGTVYWEGKKIKMPNKFIDWIKAIVPLAGNNDTPDGEQTNVQGNMNGEYSMSTRFRPAKDWEIRAYWEHYFEDHSQLTFEYGAWKDGLWGLEVSFPENPFLKKFVFEYIATKDQTGPINHDSTPEIPEQVSGGDSYYNHYLYGAWQNWGMTIGSPLLISPIYNRNHVIKVFDNRIIAQHFGLEGNPVDWVNWRVLLTFSRNWGSYRYPLPEVYNNFSGLVEAHFSPKKLKGWYASAAVAWDHGALLGNNFGAKISIGKTGWIKW